MKISALETAIRKVQTDIDVLEVVKARLIALQAREPKKRTAKASIKAVEPKAG